MDVDQINKKLEITWTAVDIYEDKRRVSIPELVNKTNLTAGEIYELFPNKKSILTYYYSAIVLQYWAMIEEIEDFESYAIGEKFSNFIYTIFDVMSEKETFVTDTFHKYVFKKGSKSNFHEEITTLFKDFLTTDSNIAVSAGFFMGSFFYKTLSSQFLFLIQYWLKDTSNNKDRSLALADKLSSLFEEIVYNKTIDKGFDLLKFILGNNDVESWLPKLGTCTSNKDKTIHIEKKDDNQDE